MQREEQNRGGSEDLKPNQERRLKPAQDGDEQQQQQHPQKCPRCESLNTKFCYFNNYSLSQPRYFCKTCRRYWTLGGTLRNVPVGGGCRKGKRTKTSSSSCSGENSGLQQQPQSQLLQHNLANPQNIISTTNSGGSLTPASRTNDSGNIVSSLPGMSSMGSYYAGGGFLSSLAAIQSFNNNQPPIHSFRPEHLNQSVDFGGDLGDISNLGVLHGFNAVPAFGSQNQQQMRQFYHGGNRDNKSVEHSFYQHEQENLFQSGRPASSSQQQQNWHQGFPSGSNPTVSNTALWSISTSTTVGNTNRNINPNASSSSLNSDQWHHDLHGYGSPQ